MSLHGARDIRPDLRERIEHWQKVADDANSLVDGLKKLLILEEARLRGEI